VVICEDIASAAKICAGGGTPYVLCGSHFDIYSFVSDNKYAGDIYVWLDNDKSEIVAQSERITKQLKLYYPSGPNVFRVMVSDEPKNHSIPAIGVVLKGASSV
jgi:hypothetical protein